MASLVLTDMPEALLARLRESAVSHGRRLDQEVLALLEEALKDPSYSSLDEEIRLQVEEWSRLAGRWKSELPVEEEIAQILESRTGGRHF